MGSGRRLHSDGPFFFADHTSTEWLRLGHTLCAVDLGPYSSVVLRWANAFAAAIHSELTILNVLERLDPAGSETYYASGWRRQLIDKATEGLAALQQNEGTHLESILEPGEVAEAIPAAAARLGADLIVIGRRGTSDCPLETHAYEIIWRSQRPVVSI
jgi:nucleotide-binding universal stress UspA family protein